MMVTLLLFLLLATLLDLCMFRPRRRASKKRAVLLNSVEPGSVVYTEDGVRGRVLRLCGGDVVLACAPDDVQLTFGLEHIARVENYNEAAAKEKMKQKVRRARERP